MISRLRSLRDRNKVIKILVFTLFFCALLAAKPTQSQNHLRDSTTAVTIVNQISSILSKNPGLAYQFCDSIIKGQPNNLELACAYKGMGFYHFDTKEFDYAQSYFNKAIALFKAAGLYDQVNHCNFLLGDCLRYKGDTNAALKQYKLAAALVLKTGNIKRIGDINNEIGRLYKTQGNFEKAIEHYFIALNSYEQSEYIRGQALMYNNIADLFNVLGIFAPAEEYLLKSIKLAQEGGYLSIECLANETLGTAYLQNNQLKKGLQYLEQSIALTDKPFTLGPETVVYIYISAANANLLNNNIGKAENYLENARKLNVDSSKTYEDGYYAIVKGRLLIKKGDITRAEQEFNNALAYAKTLESLPLRIESLEELRKIYAMTDRFKLTYLTQEEITHLSDRVDKNRISKKIAILLLNNKFEKTEKERELSKLQEQKLLKSDLKFKNLILILLLLIILFISTVVIIYYKNNKREKIISGLLQQKNDLVEAKNAEIEAQATLLLKANQTKDLIFTILAHDLRTPLNQLEMTLNLMESGDLTSGEIATLLPKLSEGLRTTSNTLDSLLYWAKSQMNGFHLKLKYHKLLTFIADEIKNNQSLLDEKDLLWSTNIPKELTILFDENLIKIIFRNLLNNAVKFSKPGGKIEVNYQDDLNYHYLSIKDFGVGMSKNQLNTLFSDATNSTMGTQKEKGVGVGLIFCKDLIKKSSGNITVNSNLNEGSSFTFSIPKQMISD